MTGIEDIKLAKSVLDNSSYPLTVRGKQYHFEKEVSNPKNPPMAGKTYLKQKKEVVR